MPQLQQSAPIIEWKDCSLVEINPLKVSGAPILKGTRMPIEAIFENFEAGMPADEIAEVFELPPASVRDLLAYAAQRKPACTP